MAIIERATVEDVPEIAIISNVAAEESVANFAIAPEPEAAWVQAFQDTQPRFPWVVAREDDRLVGFARATPWQGRCAYVHSTSVSVYIRSDQQGRGIGSGLYDALFPMLQDAGFHTAVAGITLPNAASVALHERMGMHHVGTFPEVGRKFGAWHDVGYWAKVLDPT